MEWERIFVTVGTTEFNELMEVLGKEGFLNYIVRNRCKKLIIQYGRGNPPSTNLAPQCQSFGIELEAYRFKDSLDHDMKSADLIICHAGAGSITEGLSLNKKVMVVINESLMDNHQLELANAVVEKGYCLSSTPSTLLSALENANFNNLMKYEDIDYTAFPKLLDEMFGWN